ncbi:MAG: 16S rRNA (guanine(966)-N(2))-methyltransferase RsmD [SAR324 cluster bacterium]|uniref:16S rRNA (Guanine(966)-N(2))-methyltransferase RsmD n=1 Tax=SAR324 cluster bacterium TaxID=2024889 RepID=A0A7X9IKM7_9DELT|nr:16S rRNA (guanine(966)-N(2))-methyltransferase RsmD [SAR324 cluster bacterium]
MRVIAGSAKGKVLKSVPGDSTRPISDRVKTAFFDTIRPELSNMKVLDLFAGTGSVGIEALSQGAEHAVFVELNKKAIRIIEDNLSSTGLKCKALVLNQDAFLFLKNNKRVFDLIYVAPPQYQALWQMALHHIAERPNLVSEGGLVVAQIDPKEYEELFLEDFREERQKKYGNTLLVFYRKCSMH